MENELWKEAERLAGELGLHELVQSKIDPDDQFYQAHPDFAYVTTLLNEISKKYGGYYHFSEFFQKFSESNLPNLAPADILFHDPELAREWGRWVVIMEDGELTEKGKRFLDDFEGVEGVNGG
jgi:hypothetical protein